MSEIQSPLCSKVFGTAETLADIINLLPNPEIASLVCKDFNRACVDVLEKRGKTYTSLTDFELDDRQIKQRGLSVRDPSQGLQDEIRSCRLPLVATLVLKKKITHRTDEPKFMTDAFRTFEELLQTLPNLKTILNVPIDPHPPWGFLPFSITYGTLDISKRGEGPPTLSLDGGRTHLGWEHMTPLFPVPSDTEVVHDLAVYPASYDSIPECIMGIPLTRSVTFGAATTQRDTEMPVWANTIQEAHKRLHQVPIGSMFFELAASPADSDDARSIQRHIELARGLRSQGLIGPDGLSQVGSYRSLQTWVPADISCLTRPDFARAHEGISNLSLGVAQSDVEQPWRSIPILPKSLRVLDLRYSHDDYPTRRYRSQLAEWINATGSVKITFSCNQPQGHNGQLDYHDRWGG